jgi:hypothetical protein
MRTPLLLALPLALTALNAAADTSDKPITLIVPFAAGGPPTRSPATSPRPCASPWAAPW